MCVAGGFAVVNRNNEESVLIVVGISLSQRNALSKGKYGNVSLGPMKDRAGMAIQ